MQEFGVRSDRPRDRATEEVGLGRSDLVNVLLVFLGCALRQRKLQLIAVFKRFVDDQGVLADDLICLEPEQTLLNRMCVGAYPLPPVLEILEVGRNAQVARPLGSDPDRRLLVGALVVLLPVSEKTFSKRRGYALSQYRFPGSSGDADSTNEV